LLKALSFELNEFNERTNKEAAMNKDKDPFNPLEDTPLLIVISGPSGVGKDSVLKRMKERKLPFHFVVTATTRPPRPGEVHGKDYYFLSPDEFANMIEKDELLEYAIVYNDYKGIPKAQVREALGSSKDVVMRIDVQGAATIREMSREALLIFLTTSSEEEMVNRLRARKSETPEGLNLRIAMARQELKRVHEFDYVVINREDRLDETVDVILSIITAEHHRTRPRKVLL
jgi:guanylate kinase